MSVQNLNFTKDWTNSSDFPTVETSETKVRQDLQLLHNETKEKVNEVIAVLNALSAGGIYVAVAGTTSIADLVTQINAGMTIIALDNGKVYYNAAHSESSGTYTFVFFTLDGTSVKSKTAAGTTSGTTTWSDVASYDLSSFATIASPTFTGTPAAPTPDAGTNTTQIATTEHVKDVIGRDTAVGSSDTNYTSYMARGESLNAVETTPAINGCIAWQYE